MAALVDPIPQHRRVAVFGLGLTGRAAVRLLRQWGKEVVASDSRHPDYDPQDHGVELALGRLDLRGATAVVLSPGLNLEWPENAKNPELAPVYAGLKDGTLDVWSEIDLAASAYTGKILTVGGTDGKSTTAALATHLLNRRGVPALLGGNSWRPFSEVLLENDLSNFDHVVIEVSAFQLWRPHRLTPSVALMTNIAPDHLDHYAAEDDYVNAKLHVFEHLSADAPVVLYSADARLRDWGQRRVAEGGVALGYDPDGHTHDGWTGVAHGRSDTLTLHWGDAQHSLDGVRWHLPGVHNQKNLLAALMATWALTGRPWESGEAVSDAVRGFQGLPHRVAHVRSLDGVDYYNDSKATNVHAALAGLSAFERPLVAIVGGVDKGLDLAPLFEALVDARAVVLIGELRERFVREAPATLALHESETFEAAVERARALAQPGDAVILSPACSSYDMFNSFEHRGDRFEALVRAL